jgi:hypothetical protein
MLLETLVMKHGVLKLSNKSTIFSINALYSKKTYNKKFKSPAGGLGPQKLRFFDPLIER